MTDDVNAGHSIVVRIEDEGYLSLSVRCPFDADDPSRPCWPYTEEGDPEPAPQEYCNYQEWVDNLGGESFCASDLGRFMLDCEWDAWDSPRFTIGERLP